VLKDKVVVVTGAGSGLGRALSLAFCAEGAKVVGLGRSLESLEQTYASIDSGKQDLFSFYQADVSQWADVQGVIGSAAQALGRIDYLFNNAAVYPRISFLDESAEDFSNAISVNVVGMANMCKAVLPVMLAQKAGRIFNLGSWADLSPIADSAAYSASKGAVHSLTKAIAADIAHHNYDVQVHEWIPGHLNTQMSGYTGIDPALSAAWGLMLTQRKNDKKNCLFERDQEWLPPKSLKQRIKAKLFFWKK
jgi:NAD(P)-dependent dehydrogenase (short-subunit alcohol dehydrogenase family)